MCCVMIQSFPSAVFTTLFLFRSFHQNVRPQWAAWLKGKELLFKCTYCCVESTEHRPPARILAAQHFLSGCHIVRMRRRRHHVKIVHLTRELPRQRLLSSPSRVNTLCNHPNHYHSPLWCSPGQVKLQKVPSAHVPVVHLVYAWPEAGDIYPFNQKAWRLSYMSGAPSHCVQHS